MELGDYDTCHAIPTPPACFTDADCGSDSVCVGETICNCMVGCMSEPGECEYYDDDE